MEKRIAVIIPFFKLEYFSDVLSALANQSDGRFCVYVGNDCSSLEADAVVRKFSGEIKIIYHRFEKNLGGVDLAAQWNRCVRLSNDEEWIWILPDDDVPSSNAVAEILRAADIADEVSSDVIYVPFSKSLNGTVVRSSSVETCVMGSGDFYLSQLMGRDVKITLGNSVLRRLAFDRIGGFISLPRGWGSDHATLLAVADGGDIVIAKNAELFFRMSGKNISSMSFDAQEKMLARIMFAKWLRPRARCWYGPSVAEEMMQWFYFKGEFYVTKVWPFNRAMARQILILAELCGVRRGPLQKASIILTGGAANIARRLNSYRWGR